MLLVERLEPVDLTTAHYDNVARLGFDLHAASVGGRNARGGKETGVLEHVERCSSDAVGLEHARTQVVDER